MLSAKDALRILKGQTGDGGDAETAEGAHGLNIGKRSRPCRRVKSGYGQHHRRFHGFALARFQTFYKTRQIICASEERNCRNTRRAGLQRLTKVSYFYAAERQNRNLNFADGFAERRQPNRFAVYPFAGGFKNRSE